MTPQENRSIAPREKRRFKFLKNGVEFFPGVGARLHFASKDIDTLTLPAMPPGMFSAGDAVTCRYAANGVSFTTVFVGEVMRIIDRSGRGEERVCDIVVGGPWAKMNRLVFRQEWSLIGPKATASMMFSKIQLNRSPIGGPYTIAEQINEIATYAAGRCGFSLSPIAGLDDYLPADEIRDLTCAAAIQRELRFHPKVIVGFDYNQTIPQLKVSIPAANEASYVADIPKTDREYEYNATPISCVAVETNDVTMVVDGQLLPVGLQIYPPNGDISALDCLHCYVPLAPGGVSNTQESMKLVTEHIGPDAGDKEFWHDKHPRLENVPLDAITLSETTRGEGKPVFGEEAVFAANFEYIAQNPAADLTRAGVKFKTEIFKTKCKITTENDIEEVLYLQMEFLTVNRAGGIITWQTGSSSMAGESLPEGLAQALYEQRTQSQYLNETMTVKLSDTWPKLGDYTDGLYLQSIDVDCASELAVLHFGQPEHLSAEDMRDLLNGWRGREHSFTAARQKDGDDEGDADEDIKGIPPLSSSAFSPGVKSKVAIYSAENASAIAPTGSGGIGDVGESTVGSISLAADEDYPRLRMKKEEKEIDVNLEEIPEDCEGKLSLHKISWADPDVEPQGEGGEGEKDNKVLHGIFCRDLDLFEEMGITVEGNDAAHQPIKGNKLRFESEDDTDVKITVSKDQDTGETVIKLGVYYK